MLVTTACNSCPIEKHRYVNSESHTDGGTGE